MKKKLLVLLVPLAMSIPVATGAATAAPLPTAAHKSAPTFSTPCHPNAPGFFIIDAYEVINYEKVVTTRVPNGDVVKTTTGPLVMFFQNRTTGKSFERNVSGSTTEIDHRGGKVDEYGTGDNFWAFGPNGQGHTGQPGLVFTAGDVHLTATIVKKVYTADSFELLNGASKEDGCALLSGPL